MNNRGSAESRDMKGKRFGQINTRRSNKKLIREIEDTTELTECFKQVIGESFGSEVEDSGNIISDSSEEEVNESKEAEAVCECGNFLTCMRLTVLPIKIRYVLNQALILRITFHLAVLFQLMILFIVPKNPLLFHSQVRLLSFLIQGRMGRVKIIFQYVCKKRMRVQTMRNYCLMVSIINPMKITKE